MTTAAATADSSGAVGMSRAAATITYTYDHLYRLTGVNDRGVSTTYQYDPVGNRTKRTRVALDTTYSYDKADRIQQTQVAGAATVPYSVNANGNQTARGADTFTYDQANRLTSVGLAGVQTFQYTFDGDGKRVSSSIVGIVGTYVELHL
jgi:YD repeat-containing protein